MLGSPTFLVIPPYEEDFALSTPHLFSVTYWIRCKPACREVSALQKKEGELDGTNPTDLVLRCLSSRRPQRPQFVCSQFGSEILP